MFVFSTIGIPVVSLLLSFLYPQGIQAKSIPPLEHRTVQTLTRPTLPVPSSRPVFNDRYTTTSSTTPTEVASITNQPTTQTQSTSTPTDSTAPSATPVQTDDKKHFIMNAINQYRASYGLQPVNMNDTTCNFAKIRAIEITSNFNHDGFNQRIQNHTLPYPSYSLVTENIAETSNYQEVVTMWANSPGHAANMRADTPYVCVESNSNYYAFEGWR